MQHPDEHGPKRPILLAVDQEFGLTRAAERVTSQHAGGGQHGQLILSDGNVA
jgi:hypothetical protein